MVSITMMVGLVGLTAATTAAAAATGMDGWMDGWMASTSVDDDDVNNAAGGIFTHVTGLVFNSIPSIVPWSRDLSLIPYWLN